MWGINSVIAVWQAIPPHEDEPAHASVRFLREGAPSVIYICYLGSHHEP